jgi:hypothetical protein
MDGRSSIKNFGQKTLSEETIWKTMAKMEG